MKSNSYRTGEHHQANQNSMPTATASQEYYTPAQYYQQQFSDPRMRQHQQPHVPYNPAQTPNMPMMLYQHSPAQTTSPNPTNQMVPTGQLQHNQSSGGGQYFVDAACTIPVGQSGNQQPQPLHQYAPFQQQQQQQCRNPRCERCSGQSTPASKNTRR